LSDGKKIIRGEGEAWSRAGEGGTRELAKKPIRL